MANLRTNKIVSTTGSNAITGSVEFGESDYLTLASSSDFNLGTGDFTIEFWIQPQKRFTSYPTIFEIDATNDANRLVINFRNGSTLGLTSGTTVFATNAGFNLDSWFHVAVVRQSGVSRIYKNGITGGDTACTVDFNNSGSSNIFIGWDSTITSTEKYNGFISNLRVIKGTALYTSNFIPPTAELKNIPGTVLLCCQNPSSATQEATGKTITVNGNAIARNFAPAVGSDGTVTFDGVTKISTENYFYLPTGNTEDRGRGRGVFGGGRNPSAQNSIDYISIQSQGIANDFGDLTVSRFGSGSSSSSTRGLFGGGATPLLLNTIDYVTIATTANAQDFGDLTQARWIVASTSSSTRGVWGGGYAPTTPTSNVIDFITISSTGNATDFGDLISPTVYLTACSSPTRGIFAGGQAPTDINVIQYINIASTGNAIDFGDLTVARSQLSGCSSQTRGVFAGGYVTPVGVNVIDYITIASIGNATDFGDLSSVRRAFAACSNSLRGVFAGGFPTQNTIEYVTIASTSNALDFGDLTVAIFNNAGCSDSHGGLG